MYLKYLKFLISWNNLKIIDNVNALDYLNNSSSIVSNLSKISKTSKVSKVSKILTLGNSGVVCTFVLCVYVSVYEK